ncbi:Uncharacterised protein [Klebsiella pneumoniae subsp. rhinoscleromatis]|nr:Uncharacterised protein [Klebsiella pneumoniae subsp. rhinoscleromatis]
MLEQMGIAAKAASWQAGVTLQPGKRIRYWKRSPIIWKRRPTIFCAPTRKI